MAKKSLEAVNSKPVDPKETDQSVFTVDPDDAPPVNPAATPAERIQLSSDDLEATEIEDINAFIKSSNLVSGNVRIARRNEQGVLAQCGTLPLQSFTLDQLQQQWGGGEYRLRFYRSNGDYIRTVRYDIDPRIKGKIDLDSDKSGNLTGVVQTLLEKIDGKSQTNGDDRFSQLLAFQQQQTNQMMALFLKSQDTLTATITAALSKPPPQENRSAEATMTVLSTLVAKMLEVKTDPLDSMTKMIGAMKGLKALANGEEPEVEEGGIMNNLGKLLVPVLGGLAAGGSRPPVAMPQPAQPALPLPPMPPPTPVAGPGTVVSLPAPPAAGLPTMHPEGRPFTPEEQAVIARVAEVRQKILDLLPKLIWAIRLKMSPETAVSFVDDYLADKPDHADTLAEILDQDNWHIILFGVKPEVLNDAILMEWFGKFREVYLTEDESAVAADTTEHEHTTDNLEPNPAPHGGDGVGGSAE